MCTCMLPCLCAGPLFGGGRPGVTDRRSLSSVTLLRSSRSLFCFCIFCMSVLMSVRLSVRLSVCLSVCLSGCLSRAAFVRLPFSLVRSLVLSLSSLSLKATAFGGPSYGSARRPRLARATSVADCCALSEMTHAHGCPNRSQMTVPGASWHASLCLL